MLDIIIKYVEIINDFEKKLKEKFKLDTNPWNHIGKKIPRKGNLLEYKYISHGAGFRIKKGDVICEYDVAPLNKNEIKFTVWKIIEFIESSDEYSEKFPVIESIIQKELNDLVNKKILSKLKVGDIEFDIYEVNIEKLSKEMGR